MPGHTPHTYVPPRHTYTSPTYIHHTPHEEACRHTHRHTHAHVNACSQTRIYRCSTHKHTYVQARRYASSHAPTCALSCKHASTCMQVTLWACLLSAFAEQRDKQAAGLPHPWAWPSRGHQRAGPEHTTPFVCRQELGSPTPAHFLLEAVRGTVPGHHVLGTKGPFKHTFHNSLSPGHG